MNPKFKRYDTADYLKTEADIAAYLEATAEFDDPLLTAMALGNVTRARGKSEIAPPSKPKL